MPFARPLAKLIIVVGILGCVVGRLTEEITTLEMFKYMGIAILVAMFLSMFSKKTEDSLLKLLGQLSLIVGIVAVAFYALYANFLRDANYAAIPRVIEAAPRPVYRAASRQFEKFMDTVESASSSSAGKDTKK